MKVNTKIPKFFASMGVIITTVLTIACPAPMERNRDLGKENNSTFGGQIDAKADIDKLPPILRERFQTERGRKAYKKALTNKMRLVNEARRRGFAELPKIQQSVQALEERLIVKHLLKVESEKRAITDDELALYFQKHQEDFEQKRKVRLSIFTSLDPNEERALEKARSFQRKLKKGTNAKTVASKSNGPEESHEGDIGWLTKGDRRGAYDLALTMNIGEVSKPVRIEGGYTVFVVTDKRAARSPDFEEIKEEVRNHMLPKRQRQVFDRLIRELNKGAL